MVGCHSSVFLAMSMVISDLGDCFESDCVFGLLSTKSLENLHARFEHCTFRAPELHLCCGAPHSQPGQRFPPGAGSGGTGTWARSCLPRPSHTTDKCNFFSLFCLLCLFPFQKTPKNMWYLLYCMPIW